MLIIKILMISVVIRIINMSNIKINIDNNKLVYISIY